MKFDFNKNKWLAAIMIGIALFILGSNTYNSIAQTGLIDVTEVLKQSFTSLTTIVMSVTSLLAHSRDHEGNVIAQGETK